MTLAKMTTQDHPPDPGQLDESTTKWLLARFGGVDDLHRRVATLTRSAAAPGSVAAAEMSNDPESERAYIHARALLTCALDHLGALGLLVVDARAIPAFAHMTLLRGALEPSLHARWVMGGDGADRLARGFALDFDNLDERRKFEDSAAGGSELAKGRIDELLRTAGGLGLTTVAQSGVARLRVTCPSFIDLLIAQGGASALKGDSWVYRFLSGYAHAKEWTRTLGIVVDPSVAAGAGLVGRVEAVDTYLVEMVERVWRTYLQALEMVERLWQAHTA